MKWITEVNWSYLGGSESVVLISHIDATHKEICWGELISKLSPFFCFCIIFTMGFSWKLLMKNISLVSFQYTATVWSLFTANSDSYYFTHFWMFGVFFLVLMYVLVHGNGRVSNNGNEMKKLSNVNAIFHIVVEIRNLVSTKM